MRSNVQLLADQMSPNLRMLRPIALASRGQVFRFSISQSPKVAPQQRTTTHAPSQLD